MGVSLISVAGVADVGEGVLDVGEDVRGVLAVPVGDFRPISVARRLRFRSVRLTDLTRSLTSACGDLTSGEEGSHRARGSGKSGERGSASSA